MLTVAFYGCEKVMKASYFCGSVFTAAKIGAVFSTRYVREVPFAKIRYTKEVPFLSKMVYKRMSGWTSGLSLPKTNFVLGPPPPPGFSYGVLNS